MVAYDPCICIAPRGNIEDAASTQVVGAHPPVDLRSTLK